MNMFFDWWFATSLRLRQLCWAVWLLVLVTLIFLSSTHQEERDALIRLRASHHQQWAALYRLVDATPFSEEKTLPFSPLDFQLSGAHVSVSRFSLSVEGDDLLFTLQLETPHEG